MPVGKVAQEGLQDPPIRSIVPKYLRKPVILPTYSAMQFHSKEEHSAALYDACLLIVNTYNQTDVLDYYSVDKVSPYDFMRFARNVINNIAEL